MEKGSLLIYVIIIIAVFIIIMPPVVGIFASQLKFLKFSNEREQALQIADAGINYYQWHLAHFPEDYKDGTGQPGPYVHDFFDHDTQKNIGKFSLTITPPPVGSTVSTIKSTGWTDSNPAIKRTVTVKYGIPSLATFAILNNMEVWIYYSPQIFSGKVQSNSGVRFDVQGNAPISSTKETYTCPSWQQCPQATMPGVWGSGNQSFWKYPVPAVDFASFTSKLADLKSLSQNGGLYLPPSNKQGYSFVFNPDKTVSVYIIKSLHGHPNGWTYDTSFNWVAKNANTDYNNRELLYQVPLPENGIIYAEDNVWVEGTVDGRVTLAAAKLPYNASTAPTIYIPKDIIYARKDGSCILGLISQKDIAPTYYAEDDLEIDAALISQNSMVSFYYYPNNIKNTIRIYGSIIEFGWWFDNFVWTSGINDNVISGYRNSYYTYDSNLLYYPPPSFPLASSGYQLLSWQSD